MPHICIYQPKSFAPFPTPYSSKTFTPLVWENHQICHIQHLLLGLDASIVQFRHYLTTCSTIFSLENALHELQENWDHVFNKFITVDTVHRLQPFLVQACRHEQPPVSIITTSESDTSQPQPPFQWVRNQTVPCTTSTTPPCIPHTQHANLSLSITAPQVIHTPTLIPSTSFTCYLSTLVTYFNPCASCGAAKEHFPGCTAWDQGLQGWTGGSVTLFLALT